VTAPDTPGADPRTPGDRGTHHPDPGDRGTHHPDPGDRGTHHPDPGDRGTHHPDPGDRGRTTIAPLVLRKVVEHACDTTGATVSVPRSIVGRDVDVLGLRGSVAVVTVLAADAVAVRLEVALRRPVEVRRAAVVVRRAVDEALARTTGHRVRTMDLVVTALPAASGAGRVA
jgi:uncharacterized alkaline shock family protein YloU